MRYAAFLRGVMPVNASMPDLKRTFEAAGFTEVATLLSSGNVVFTAPAASPASLERRAEAAMTKLSISEAFAASSLDAIRLHGATGYLSEHAIERDLRDATGGLIYVWTSDIQRNLIARLTGL